MTALYLYRAGFVLRQTSSNSCNSTFNSKMALTYPCIHVNIINSNKIWIPYLYMFIVVSSAYSIGWSIPHKGIILRKFPQVKVNPPPPRHHQVGSFFSTRFILFYGCIGSCQYNCLVHTHSFYLHFHLYLCIIPVIITCFCFIFVLGTSFSALPGLSPPQLQSNNSINNNNKHYIKVVCKCLFK